MNNFRTQTATSTATNVDAGLKKYMLRVYNMMFLALAITGFVAFFASESDVILSSLYNFNSQGQITGNSGLGWIVTLAPLGFVLFFSFGMGRMSPDTASAMFFIYSGVMGLSMTSIFLLYTGESVARVFFITAGIFGAMSLYGYTTKKDLSKMGSILMMGLFAVIIASVINIFLQSSGMQFILSLACVVIFTGLIAYDSQKLKGIYYQYAQNEAMLHKSAVMGALSLYLDFINLFIHLLQFMGNRRS